jgi:hypothetical protein
MEIPGYREDILLVLQDMLGGRDNVRRGSMMGLPAFFTGTKMFACCYDDGVGVKLPAGRVAELRATDDQIDSFGPGGRVMKEWVYIRRGDADEYRADLDLLDEALAFVAGAAKASW